MKAYGHIIKKEDFIEFDDNGNTSKRHRWTVFSENHGYELARFNTKKHALEFAKERNNNL